MFTPLILGLAVASVASILVELVTVRYSSILGLLAMIAFIFIGLGIEGSCFDADGRRFFSAGWVLGWLVSAFAYMFVQNRQHRRPKQGGKDGA